ncbi:MAG: DMT family transporter [Bacteroidetes bacterium]|nr:DMT family transporter [Bacteroidota bacterium]
MRMKVKYRFAQGIFIALGGAILFSTKAIWVKLAYREAPVDALTLLALRMIFSLPFFIGAAFVSSSQSTNVKFTKREWMGIALIGCLGYYISSLLDFAGLKYVSAGMERLILFAYPTFALLMSAFLFKQEVKPIQWLALTITYFGLIAAFLGEVDFGSAQNSNFVFGSVLIFICAITYAGYMVGSGRIIPKVGASKFNSYAMSFAGAGVLIHFFIHHNGSLVGQPAIIYLYSLLMAVFATVLPSYLVAASINKIGANNVAIIGSVGPVSTIVLANIFLGEAITFWQLLGTALILVGVLLIGKQANQPES